MRIWRRPAVHVLALVVLGAAVFLPNLGQDVHLDGRDVRHAEIAREMAERGSYIVPYLCGRPYIDKPPLFNSTVALLFRLTGRVNFFLSRLPSALCAIAAMVGIYVLGVRWYCARAGLLGAVVWATSRLVTRWARFTRMDMMLATLVLFSLVLADLAAAAARRRARVALWCAACAVAGAAVLSKGPFAILFFGVGVMALWRARRGRWLPPVGFLVLGAGVMGLVGGAWAAAAELSHPGHLKAMLNYQFGEALVEHPKRFCLYFDQILQGTLPWGLFAPGAIWWLVRRLRRVGYDCVAVPALILGVCLVGLTLTPNKRAHYMLPILPMWALFLAAFVDHGLRRSGTGGGGERMPRWAFAWPLRVCLVALCVGAAAAPVLLALKGHGSIVGWAIFFGLATVAAGAGAVAAWRGRTARAVAALFLVGAAVTVALRPVVVRHYWKPSPENVALRDLARQIPPDAPVAAYEAAYEYLYFTMNRPVFFAQHAEELRPFLAAAGPRYVVVKARHAAEVLRVASRPLGRIGSWQLRRRRVVLLATEPSREARLTKPPRRGIMRHPAVAGRAATPRREQRSRAWSPSACR